MLILTKTRIVNFVRYTQEILKFTFFYTKNLYFKIKTLFSIVWERERERGRENTSISNNIL